MFFIIAPVISLKIPGLLFVRFSFLYISSKFYFVIKDHHFLSSVHILREKQKGFAYACKALFCDYFSALSDSVSSFSVWVSVSLFDASSEAAASSDALSDSEDSKEEASSDSFSVSLCVLSSVSSF